MNVPFIVARYINYVGGFYVSSNARLMIWNFVEYLIYLIYNIVYINKWKYLMKFEWDDAKNQSNIEKHGIDFEDAKQLFVDGFWFVQDERKDYGEPRFIGLGYINRRLLSVVFTERKPNKIRIISLRKANLREVQAYEARFKDWLESSW